MNDEETHVLDGLLGFLREKSAKEQLRFWEKFRETHRNRIASTDAPLCPQLLYAVDEQIEALRPLAAAEV